LNCEVEVMANDWAEPGNNRAFAWYGLIEDHGDAVE
jgi:hypothetical protein